MRHGDALFCRRCGEELPCGGGGAVKDDIIATVSVCVDEFESGVGAGVRIRIGIGIKNCVQV